MAKTNFTKAEEAFDEGMRKAVVSKLTDMAPTSPPDKLLPLTAKPSIPQLSPTQRQLIASLKHDLKYLQKEGHNPYEKLGINKKEFQQMIENPTVLTLQEWEQIQKYKEKVSAFKKELETQTTDESRVQQQRDEHINKRFNINKKWLPLK